MATKPATLRLPRSVTATAGLAGFLLAGGVLYWAQAILIPIALAILFTFVLSPLVIRLQRGGLPKSIAVPTVVLAAFGVLGLFGWLMSAQVVQLAEELPERKTQIIEKIDNLLKRFVPAKDTEGNAGLGGLVEDVQKKIDEATPSQSGPFGLPPIPVQIEAQTAPIQEAATTLLAPLVEPLATAGLVVVLVIFMLLKREDLRNRIVTLSGRANLAVTTKALDEAGKRIARYLLMQLVINVTYGIAVTIGLLVLGVPYAVLWGVAAAILRYVPYIGPWIAAALPIAYSALTEPGWMQPLGVVGLIVVLELLSNNVMEPLLYGRGVGVSEIAVILSAVFWGWLWGPIGLVLATPLTACLVVAGRYVPALSFFNRIFGDAPEVDPAVVYYQRLLARDEDEAEELFDEAVDGASFKQACEEIVVPALESVKHDRLARSLDAEHAVEIVESIGEHVADASLPAADEEQAAAEASQADATRPVVFGFPIRDAEDEVAMLVMSRLLERASCRFVPLSRSVLFGEVLEKIREERPAGLCLIGVAPGGLPQARTLCKRLRASIPDLNVAVGRWAGPVTEKHRAALRDEGATYVGQTPTETRDHILSMARLRPTTDNGGDSRTAPAAIGSSG